MGSSWWAFTSGNITLGREDEPGDYKALADFAARGTTQKPILTGASEGAGLSVLAATNPQTKLSIAGVLGSPSSLKRTSDVSATG